MPYPGITAVRELDILTNWDALMSLSPSIKTRPHQKGLFAWLEGKLLYPDELTANVLAKSTLPCLSFISVLSQSRPSSSFRVSHLLFNSLSGWKKVLRTNEQISFETISSKSWCCNSANARKLNLNFAPENQSATDFTAVPGSDVTRSLIWSCRSFADVLVGPRPAVPVTPLWLSPACSWYIHSVCVVVRLMSVVGLMMGGWGVGWGAGLDNAAAMGIDAPLIRIRDNAVNQILGWGGGGGFER